MPAAFQRLAHLSEQRVCVIYCRVSKEDQKDNGTSLESQERYCLEFAAKQGWKVLRVVKEDFTGTKLDERKLFAGVREDIRTGKANILLCYYPDRMTRDQTDALIIFRSICQVGADLWFAQSGSKLEDTPMGKAMLILYATGGAMELAQIRERSMRGRLQRLREYKIHNAGVPLYGYRIDKKAGRRVIYEQEAQVVRLIYHLCAVEKLGVHQIVLKLIERGIPTPSEGERRRLRKPNPIWQKSAVWRILRNVAYKGETVQWTRTTCDSDNRTARPRPESEHVRLPEGVTPPIVTPEIWQAAQEQLNSNRGTIVRNSNKPVLLRGHILCAYCNRGMYPTSDRKLRYRCYSQESPGAKKCQNRRVPADRVEPFVWSWVASILKITRDIETMQQEGPNPQWVTDLRIAKEALEKTKDQMGRVIGRIARADSYDVDIFERELARLKKARAGLEGMILELEQRIASSQKQVADLSDLRDYAARKRARIDSYGFAEKRTAIEQLGIKVYVESELYRIDFPVAVKQEFNIYHMKALFGTPEEIPTDVQEYFAAQPKEAFPDPPAEVLEKIRSGKPFSIGDIDETLGSRTAVVSLSRE